MQSTAAAQAAPELPSASGRGASILIMAVAGFSLLTTEFLIVGLLPAIAQDLQLSISVAGQIVSLFAFTVMISGPFLTSWLGHLERKKLFIAILLVFCFSNVLAAVSQDFWVLAIARVIAALALPVFWGTASESAAQIAAPGREGRAVAQVYMGITAAFVFGIPLGTLIGDVIGWRGSFWFLAILCLVVAILMAVFMPALPPSPRRISGSSRKSILKEPRFIGHVLLSVLCYTAMFAAYTYLADTLQRIAGIPAGHVGWWLLGFGVVGMVGNYIGVYLVDKDALRATNIFLIVMAVGMAATAPLAGNYVALIGALVFWSIGYTALFPVNQVRAMQAAEHSKALAATINVSAANGGIGMGAVVGGGVIQAWCLSKLGYVASALALVSILFSLILIQRKAP